MGEKRPHCAASCIFNRAIRGQSSPNYLTTDNDPLYRFPQWQANLRVLEVAELKTVPYVPLSLYPIRLWSGSSRPYAENAWTPRYSLFWTAIDLEGKLLDFGHYYNAHRTPRAPAGNGRQRRSLTSKS